MEYTDTPLFHWYLLQVITVMITSKKEGGKTPSIILTTLIFNLRNNTSLTQFNAKYVNELSWNVQWRTEAYLL